jgi:hypothetical protein
MAKTVETTTRINRRPDRAIMPPIPTLTKRAAAHGALASPRGMSFSPFLHAS